MHVAHLYSIPTALQHIRGTLARRTPRSQPFFGPFPPTPTQEDDATGVCRPCLKAGGAVPPPEKLRTLVCQGFLLPPPWRGVRFRRACRLRPAGPGPQRVRRGFFLSRVVRFCWDLRSSRRRAPRGCQSPRVLVLYGVPFGGPGPHASQDRGTMPAVSRPGTPLLRVSRIPHRLLPSLPMTPESGNFMSSLDPPPKSQ